MAATNSRSSRTPSVRERSARLRDKLIANALLQLDDWTPLPREEYRGDPEADAVAKAANDQRAALPHVAIRYCPPPVRPSATEYAYHALQQAG